MLDIDFFMNEAIKVASESLIDVPIGALVVRNGEILASAHNEKELKNNSTLHAEMIVIQKAQEVLGRWRLDDCELFVTLEPCPMCAWAIIQARFKSVYFGASDVLYGALGGALDLRKIANSDLVVVGGIKEKECSELLRNYMKKIRE